MLKRPITFPVPLRLTIRSTNEIPKKWIISAVVDGGKPQEFEEADPLSPKADHLALLRGHISHRRGSDQSAKELVEVPMVGSSVVVRYIPSRVLEWMVNALVININEESKWICEV